MVSPDYWIGDAYWTYAWHGWLPSREDDCRTVFHRPRLRTGWLDARREDGCIPVVTSMPAADLVGITSGGERWNPSSCG